MKFSSREEMAEYIQEGNDLYNPVTREYLFVYNNKGAICSYRITNENAKKLSQTVAKDDYWSSELGPGGYIYDNPIEACENYQDSNWVNTKDY